MYPAPVPPRVGGCTNGVNMETNMAYPSFRNAGTATKASRKLPNSNLGADNTTARPVGVAQSTTAMGDKGPTSLRRGAPTTAGAKQPGFRRG